MIREVVMHNLSVVVPNSSLTFKGFYTQMVDSRKLKLGVCLRLSLAYVLPIVFCVISVYLTVCIFATGIWRLCCLFDLPLYTFRRPDEPYFYSLYAPFLSLLESILYHPPSSTRCRITQLQIITSSCLFLWLIACQLFYYQRFLFPNLSWRISLFFMNFSTSINNPRISGF